MSNPTILERVRDNPDELLFRSDTHRVFAAVDAFPRLPYQCVVAPFYGNPGKPAHFNNLDPQLQMKLFLVASAIGQKVLRHCTDQQRAVTHIEGFGITDHPHILVFAAERKQGANLYTGENLGLVAVQNTIEAIRFLPEEAQELEARLREVG